MFNSISKQLLLLSLLWLVTLQGYAQGFTCGTSGGSGTPLSTATTLFTGNGENQTPRGNLHILVIYTYNVTNPDNDPAFVSAGWPVAPNPSDPDPLFRTTYTRIPTWAQNDGLLNNTVATIGSNPNNLSAYYKDMSQGQFLLTGYVFPAQVPCPYNNGSPDYAAALAWIEANKNIVAPGFSWADFDQRTNSPNFATDNSVIPVSDNIIDYIVFFNRKYSQYGGSGEQTAMNSTINIPGTNYKGGVYHHCLPCATNFNQNFELFTHELSHGMVDMPHVMGANGTDGPYYYSAHGWGMMGHSNHVPFPGANAWEKWYWGWMQPQEITTSGTYTLGLLHNPAGADAIRIPVPGTNNTQYLWLEYHQPEYGMTVPTNPQARWDRPKMYFGQRKNAEPGIYGYVTAAPLSNRSTPAVYNKTGSNGIRLLNAEGRHDIAFTGTDGQIPIDNSDWLTFEVGAENPFAGQHSLEGIRGDLEFNTTTNVWSPNGSITIGRDGVGQAANEQGNIFSERKNGQTEASLSALGDEDDAFSVGDKIGIDGIIPVTNTPVYTLGIAANGTNDPYLNHLEPFKINGLEIYILGYDQNTNRYTIQVNFNQYEVRNNKRWCGHLVLPNTQNDVLTITNGATLTVDMSGTPNRSLPHTTTQTFAAPTVLELESGAQMRVDPGAELIIQNHSEVNLLAGSSLEISGFCRVSESAINLQNGSFMRSMSTIVETNSSITVDEGSSFEIDQDLLLTANSLLDLKPNSYFQIISGVQVNVEQNSILKVQSGSMLYVLGTLSFNTAATLQVMQGATLHLVSGSTLFIDDVSWANIAGTIIIEQGVSIILQHSSSKLKLAGEVVMEANSSLTFSGSGQIDFNLPNKTTPAGTPAPNITGIGNFTVNFQGINTSDVVATIAFNSRVILPSQATQIRVNQGRVEIAENSWLDVGIARVLFQHAFFTRLGVSGLYKAIYLNGQDFSNFANKSIIENCTFQFGDDGLYARSLGLNSKNPKIVNCAFNNCAHAAFYFNNLNATIEGCNFTDCLDGIRGSGSAKGITRILNTKIERIVPTTAQKIGIRYAVAMGTLAIYDSEITNQSFGVNFESSGAIHVFCSKIQNNETGFFIKTGTLRMGRGLGSSQIGTRFPGNVNASGNKFTMDFNQAQMPILRNGNNNLQPTTDPTITGELVAKGQVKFPGAIQAHFNWWKPSGSGPVSGVDYQLSSYLNGYTATIVDNNPQSSMPACVIPAPNPNPNIRPWEGLGITINTPSFENVVLDVAMDQAADVLYGPDQEIESPIAAANLFHEILMEDYSTAQFEDIPMLQISLDLSLAAMREALAEGIERDLIPSQRSDYPGGELSGIPALYSEAALSLADRYAEIDTRSTERVFQTRAERALMFSMIGWEDKAAQELEPLYAIADADEESFLAHWICQMNLLRSLRSGETDVYAYEAAAESCPALSDNAPAARPAAPTPATETATAPMLTLVPNPAQESVVLQWGISTGSMAEEAAIITLYAADGRNVLTMNAEGEIATLDLRALPAGVYLVQVQTTGGIVQTARLAVQR